MAGQILIQRGSGGGGGGSGTPGGSNTQVQYNDGGAFGGDAGLVFDETTDLLTADHVLLAQGTITDPELNLSGTVTWNDAADTFTAWKLDVTDTNSHTDSKALDIQVGATTRFDVRKDGYTRVRTVNGTGPAYFDVTDHVGNTFFRVHNDYIAIRNGLRDFINSGNAFNLGISGTASFFSVSSSSFFEFRPDEAGSAGDLCMRRAGTKSIGFFDSTATTPTGGAAIRLMEMTAPGTPSSAQVQIYAEDNGSGKTRLMAKFDDGSTAQICIQP